jgi:hypothetical protein
MPVDSCLTNIDKLFHADGHKMFATFTTYTLVMKQDLDGTFSNDPCPISLYVHISFRDILQHGYIFDHA